MATTANTIRQFWALALLALPMVASADPLQSERSIRNAAKHHIAARHPWKHLDHEVVAGRLDSRSRLPRCAGPLEAFTPPRAVIRQRTTVGVRCTAGSSWTIYLPVTVNAFANALVATRPLPRGSVLDESSVRSVKRNISALGYGYIDNLQIAGGYRASRSISAGAVITPNMVESAVMIKRGQTVTLFSRYGSVGVSMTGVAASDASLGNRISVKNLKSGKTVEGIVRSSEMVEVLL
ncbi:flagellar basal body P-ring formation chaperone FlgA [Litorivivens sp.]|uniref:flagellar basal body P-ring formation chaperone FlgA n=1 Tax=Litorivivens sp. TaxID=2020868 RepID=UPI0035646998